MTSLQNLPLETIIIQGCKLFSQSWIYAYLVAREYVSGHTYVVRGYLGTSSHPFVSPNKTPSRLLRVD